MISRRLPCTFAALVCAAGAALAQDAAAQRAAQLQAAVDAALSSKAFHIATSTEGDLDGDGIADLAAVVVNLSGEGPREERLLVLAGTPGGGYTPLSVSGQFCRVEKFYNLDIARASLWVQGVSSAEPSGMNSFTMQFRYNPKLRDFELIGKDDLAENYDTASSYRVSVNYLAKVAVHTRIAGKKRKDLKAPLQQPAVLRLRGFHCGDEGPMGPAIYINEDFTVRR